MRERENKIRGRAAVAVVVYNVERAVLGCPSNDSGEQRVRATREQEKWVVGPRFQTIETMEGRVKEPSSRETRKKKTVKGVRQARYGYLIGESVRAQGLLFRVLGESRDRIADGEEKMMVERGWWR